MSESTLSTCAQELEANLNQETALYEQLCELARETELAAKREDNEAVGELMQRKSGLIAELQRISAVTDRLKQDFATYRDVPDEIHKRVSEMLRRAATVLEELLNVERTSEKPLRAMKDSIQAELREAGRGRQVLKGYRQAREIEPRFMDKRQ